MKRGHRSVRIAVALGLVFVAMSYAGAQDATKKSLEGGFRPSGVLRVDPLLIAEAGEVWNVVASPSNPIWPGWDASKTPLLFYLPGQQDVLINHPRPPAGFVPYTGPLGFPGARVAVKNGPTLIEADGQNTHKDVAGVQTLVVADTLSNLRNHISDLLLDTRPAAEKVRTLGLSDIATDHYHQLALVVHEAFHVFQQTQAPDKGANEMLLLNYPVLSVENNVGWAEEGAALAEALRATEAGASRRAAVRWLALRNNRRASLPPAAVDYEDGVEFSEGLANYTEYRLFQALEGRRPGAAMSWAQGFAGYGDLSPQRNELIDDMVKNMSGAFVVNNDPYGTAPVRFRLYYSGMGVGVMLDRLLPEWKQRIFLRDVSLTSLAGEALKPSQAEMAKALEDVRGEPGHAALVESKTKLAEEGKAHAEAVLNDIEKGPGTGVIVDYSNLESPRLAMGFTPFGITKVDGERTIFSQVPIRVAFGKEGEVTQKVAAPLLRDTGRRLVRFRLPRVTARAELEKALASVQTSDGTVTNLALETSDVTIKAAKARITWSGPDLMITLLMGG
jgi:hypothetical protein